MSAEATGWVWKNSPCEGSQLLVHLAIADVVNDLHANEFWMSTYSLAKKARVSRSTVVSTLSDLVKAGMLEVLKEGARDRTPTRYRFCGLGQSGGGLGQSEAVTSAVSARNTKEPNEHKKARPVSGLVLDEPFTEEQRAAAKERAREALSSLPSHRQETA